MTRREFPAAVKVAVIKRCTREGVVYCEGCGLPTRKWQIDHVIADGLGGEPVLANAELICAGCFGVKNPKDTTRIARAKRREAKHLGARKAPSVTIQSAGFSPSRRRRAACALHRSMRAWGRLIWRGGSCDVR